MHTKSKDNGNIISNTSPSALAMIRAVNQRFNKTGSVEDLPCTGRPAIVLAEEKLEVIRDMVDTHPRLSIRQGPIPAGIAEVDIMLLCRNDN